MRQLYRSASKSPWLKSNLNIWKIVKRASNISNIINDSIVGRCVVGRRSELVNPRGKEGGGGGGGGKGGERRRDVGAYKRAACIRATRGRRREEEKEKEEKKSKTKSKSKTKKKKKKKIGKAVKSDKDRDDSLAESWPIEKERKSTYVCEKEKIEEMPGFAAPTQVEMDAVRGYP
ncbi:hypothetical protein HZH68_012755 [Vespula germanica]|uniref:Uncharacterized protein n=1 Tax=Vespula germanica TaxID=30212 RepID=A0A834MXW3_VESGE|nr:hypothetical protein HZH68_012755 [Vespula germanica]